MYVHSIFCATREPSLHLTTSIYNRLLVLVSTPILRIFSNSVESRNSNLQLLENLHSSFHNILHRSSITTKPPLRNTKQSRLSGETFSASWISIEMWNRFPRHRRAGALKQRRHSRCTLHQSSIMTAIDLRFKIITLVKRSAGTREKGEPNGDG